jgi:hypothetical protein
MTGSAMKAAMPSAPSSVIIRSNSSAQAMPQPG